MKTTEIESLPHASTAPRFEQRVPQPPVPHCYREFCAPPRPRREAGARLVLTGEGLRLQDTVAVGLGLRKVELDSSEQSRQRLNQSVEFVRRAVEEGHALYGVTTGVGGMADRMVASKMAAEFQNRLLWCLRAGAGSPLAARDVRGAMLLRANSLMRGHSGIRRELIERYVTFLNSGITPVVRQWGSIGASGDLVPLSHIAMAVTGQDASLKVDFNGVEMGSHEALRKVGLGPIRLGPKEGLALVNGTSVLTAIAANCLQDAQELAQVSLGAHALFVQALRGSDHSFVRFVHAQKAHPGQGAVAARMMEMLEGSRLWREESKVEQLNRAGDLVQDRYSLRCLPQFLGPTWELLARLEREIEVEMNSSNDNPLIDPEEQRAYHCGNFLGQYVGVGMDQLRQALGLMAKHMDTQIALAVTPHFSQGLPASLVGSEVEGVNMGLKGLQICGNSIVPHLEHLGGSFVDRFPTHAEQYNQNINSLGFGAATLARQSLDLMRHHLAISLIFAVQAVDLRALRTGSKSAAFHSISPGTRELYSKVKTLLGKDPEAPEALVEHDHSQALDEWIDALSSSLDARGELRDF